MNIYYIIFFTIVTCWTLYSIFKILNDYIIISSISIFLIVGGLSLQPGMGHDIIQRSSARVTKVENNLIITSAFPLLVGYDIKLLDGDVVVVKNTRTNAWGYPQPKKEYYSVELYE
jgi:hypothetical protein